MYTSLTTIREEDFLMTSSCCYKPVGPPKGAVARHMGVPWPRKTVFSLGMALFGLGTALLHYKLNESMTDRPHPASKIGLDFPTGPI